jgi:hypothetical protein
VPSGSPRGNIVAYTASTGVLTSFAPKINGEVKSVVASPDGKTLYVGGSFTAVDGLNRYRLAAFSTATGALLSTFAPTLDATVDSISVSADSRTVYVSGVFGTVQGVTRTRLAAFNAADGSLTGWAPSADAEVQAILVSPTGGRVIVGGMFTSINGTLEYGLASLDATTGAVVPWAANKVIMDEGPNAAILSLSTDGTSIFGTGYVYGQPVTGNFEGVFSAAPTTGDINWLEDCHGDSYGAYATGGAVYVASHEHFCANVGGFPDINGTFYRGTAFTDKVTGTVRKNGEVGSGYGNFAGQPSPSLIDWLPDLTAGTATKQDQAAWSVTGNGTYVVMGGEFPSVNGVAQQGLVRFAIPSHAPNKQGPIVASAGVFVPTAKATSPTSVRLTWPTVYDRDDLNLTYSLIRADEPNTPICSVVIASLPWKKRTGTCVDSSVTAGSTYSYLVRATDPSGNAVSGSPISTTLPAGPATLAADKFNRRVTNKWGTATTGGPWSISAGSTHSAVNYNVAQMVMHRPKATGTESLRTIAAADPDIQVETEVSARGTGRGTVVSLIGRQTDTGSYRLKEEYLPGGRLALVLVRVVGAKQTTIKQVALKGVTYTPHTLSRIRFAMSAPSTSGATTFTGTVWPVGKAEPATPQLTATDSLAALRAAGNVGLASYLSGSSTVSVTTSFNNLTVRGTGA